MSTIDGFTITNGSGSNGAGICCDSASATIINNTIRNNAATGNGGGIYCNNSSSIIRNCWIVMNASGSSGYGGGVYLGSSKGELVNNTIAQNWGYEGGGIYLAASSTKVYNNIIVDNSKGVYKSSDSTTELMNNDVWRNLGDTSANWKPSCQEEGPADASGNVIKDPKFLCPNSGDFHITSTSGCIDAGLDSVATWSEDVDKQIRKYGSHVDIGADEWNGADPVANPTVIRVNPSGSDGDGSSWADAKKTIAAAITAIAARGCGEVWVKAGTYNERITLVPFVHLYGGFDENDTSFTDRNWKANVTILDGGNGGSVVTASSRGMNTIDGFTVQNGTSTNGGGISCTNAIVAIAHNRIQNNVATSGGGIYVSSPAFFITDNVIIGNVNTFDGGGIYLNTGNGEIINNTIVCNINGGLYTGTAYIVNNIVAYNQGGGIKRSGGSPTLQTNNVYGNGNYQYSGLTQPASDLAVEPQFLNIEIGDVHIKSTSLCKDAGRGTVRSSADIDCDSRVSGTYVDIGADEWSDADPTVPPTPVIRVKPDGNDSNDGSTWALAKQRIQTAIDRVSQLGGGDVWVKTGTYNERITLPSFVHIYGGFAGTPADENDKSARDWQVNPTVIDGTGLSGSVVTVNKSNRNRIDGFIIQNGNTTGSGGGISCSNSMTVIAHNVIRRNTAAYNGGGIFGSVSTLTVNDNIIAWNKLTGSSYKGGGIYYWTTDGDTVNNTIVSNTSLSSSGGGGISIAGSPILSNNIIAFNTGGGVYKESGTPVFQTNNVYGNSGYEYNFAQPGGDITPTDPRFVDIETGDYHILPSSGCIDRGTNDATKSDLDFDKGSRIYGSHVDIGADESDGCTWYKLSITASPNYYTQTGNVITITANVSDLANGVNVAGHRVDVSIDDGVLQSITPNGTLTSSTSGYALTDSNGNITFTVTRDTQGSINAILSTTSKSCGSGNLIKALYLWFHNPQNSADWPMFHHDVTLQGVTSAMIGSSLSDPDPAKRLPKKWVAQLNVNYNTAQEITWSSPVVADSVVYVGTNTGWLYAYDVISGTKLAELNVGAPIHGTPCVQDGFVYVGVEYGDTSSSPGRLYVYAIDRQAEMFVEQWRYDCPTNHKIWGSISVYNGAVYFGTTANASGFTDGWFHTIDMISHQDRSGSPAYMMCTAVGVAPGIDVDYLRGDGTSEPRAYLSDFSCYVTAVKCSNGAKVWEWYADGASMYASPVIYDGNIYVGSCSSRVYKLKDDGDIQPGDPTTTPPPGDAWLLSTSSAVLSTPACWNGDLYFGCNDQYIYCVDASTFAWPEHSKKNLGSAVYGSPAISSTAGLVFVGSLNAKVYALDASNLANERWSYDIRTVDNKPNAKIQSSPAVVDGQLFIVAGDSSNRYLYCFGD